MTDPQDSFGVRLDALETRWSLVRRAHQATMSTGIDARQALALRYGGAIRAYLGAMTRNDEETDELAQEVVVKIMQGDFGGADPSRGRFRDLLKTALRNMVRNRWRKKKRRKTADYDLSDVESAAEEDPAWNEAFAKNVLDLAWSALEDYERTHAGSISFTVLRARTDHPQASSDELAEKLTTQLGKEMKPATFRQQLRRARLRFAEFLVKEVADGLADPSPDRVQDELITLGLFEHVRDLLPEEWATTP